MQHSCVDRKNIFVIQTEIEMSVYLIALTTLTNYLIQTRWKHDKEKL